MGHLRKMVHETPSKAVDLSTILCSDRCLNQRGLHTRTNATQKSSLSMEQNTVLHGKKLRYTVTFLKELQIHPSVHVLSSSMDRLSYFLIAPFLWVKHAIQLSSTTASCTIWITGKLLSLSVLTTSWTHMLVSNGCQRSRKASMIRLVWLFMARQPVVT